MGGKAWPATKTDNLAAIWEPIVKTRECWILEILQPYGPLRTVTWIALLTVIHTCLYLLLKDLFPILCLNDFSFDIPGPFLTNNGVKY
jgi:hypothetical protein